MNLLLRGLLSGWWNVGYRLGQVPSLCCFSVWCFKRCLTLTVKLQIFITLVKSKLNSEVKSLPGAVVSYVAIFHITFLTNPWRFHDIFTIMKWIHTFCFTVRILFTPTGSSSLWDDERYNVNRKPKKKSLGQKASYTKKSTASSSKNEFLYEYPFFSEVKLNIVNFHLQMTKFILSAKGRESKVNLASKNRAKQNEYNVSL